MILTLKELAEYLKINERSIQRMLSTGQISGTKIGGQWRFNGSQIDRIFFPEKPLTSDDVPLSELVHSQFEIPLSRLIQEDRIVLDMKATDMETAIEELTSPKVFNNLVLDIQDLREKSLDRERLLNTGVGEGIAIPHPREPISTLRAPGCLVIGRSKAGVTYEKTFEVEGKAPVESKPMDGGPVHLFFFICAQTIELHLHMEGKVAMLVNDADFIKACNEATEPVDIIRAIMTFERKEIMAAKN